MKIMSFNTAYCTGISQSIAQYPAQYCRYFYSGTGTLERLIRFVKSINPNVLVLTEIDSGSFRGKSVNQIEKIAQANNFRTSIYTVKYGHRSLVGKLPILKNQCNAILAKRERLPYKFHYFDCGVKRLIIEAKIAPNISLFAVHLALGKKTRLAQIKKLSRLVADTQSEVIIAGDFNVTTSSELAPLTKSNRLISANQNCSPTFPTWSPKHELDFFLLPLVLRSKNLKF